MTGFRLAKPAYWATGTAGSNPALSAICPKPTERGLRRANREGESPRAPVRGGTGGVRLSVTAAVHRPRQDPRVQTE